MATAKFLVGDWVRCSCPGPWCGTVATIVTVSEPFYEIKNHLGSTCFHESWLTSSPMPPRATPAVPSGSPAPAPAPIAPAVPQSNVQPSNVQPSEVLRSKVEPVCPACGSKSEFNYVGFMAVECVRFGCVHFNVKALEKAIHG